MQICLSEQCVGLFKLSNGGCHSGLLLSIRQARYNIPFSNEVPNIKRQFNDSTACLRGNLSLIDCLDNAIKVSFNCDGFLLHGYSLNVRAVK